MKRKALLVLLVAGLVIGALAIFLMVQGNPKNMGFCIACFVRDTAGGLKLHQAAPVQYVRPEVIGLILGSFLISVFTKEFRVRGGSSPVLRFLISFFVMVGALVFLGCPFRMVLRMAAGDLNAWVGLIGFVAGIFVGTLFLKRGFSLKRSHDLPLPEGLAMPLVQVVMLLLLLAFPALLAFSKEGPGAMHAPIWISLAVAVVVGFIAQKTRLCQVGCFRDLFMFKDPQLLMGTIGMFFGALVFNLAIGNFKIGFDAQPIAHDQALWNILGLFLVGFGSVLLGGCPMRQLILTGTGNTDSAISVLGLLVGAAFSHNFGIASAATVIKEGVKSGGTTANGRAAVVVGIVVLLLVALFCSRKEKSAKN